MIQPYPRSISHIHSVDAEHVEGVLVCFDGHHHGREELAVPTMLSLVVLRGPCAAEPNRPDR